MSGAPSIYPSDMAAEVRKAESAPGGGGELLHLPILPRPKTRGECEGGARPCPFVSCRYNLYLHVTREGGLQFPHARRGVLAPEMMPAAESCALDVADAGEHDLLELAPVIGKVRARVGQIVDDARAKMRRGLPGVGIRGVE